MLCIYLKLTVMDNKLVQPILTYFFKKLCSDLECPLTHDQVFLLRSLLRHFSPDLTYKELLNFVQDDVNSHYL